MREGQVGAWEEPQEEDGHLAGGRQTETREVMTEGEDRADKTETGGTWSRRSQNWTQGSAIMATHVRADRGRSQGGRWADDSRGATNGGGAGGGGA